MLTLDETLTLTPITRIGVGEGDATSGLAPHFMSGSIGFGLQSRRSDENPAASSSGTA